MACAQLYGNHWKHFATSATKVDQNIVERKNVSVPARRRSCAPDICVSPTETPTHGASAYLMYLWLQAKITVMREDRCRKMYVNDKIARHEWLISKVQFKKCVLMVVKEVYCILSSVTGRRFVAYVFNVTKSVYCAFNVIYKCWVVCSA